MDLGQVFTSEKIANYMVSKFTLENDARILEPCFGAGVFLEACKKRGYVSLVGYEIDKELFASVKGKYPEYSLYCRDFLSLEPTEKYDGIIMNPPYVRQEKIDDLFPLGITKNKLRKNTIFKELPSTANLYMYFLIKALDLLKDNGQLIVIFPSSWMRARNGSKFEKLLLASSVVTEEIHVRGEVFEKDVLVDVIILKIVKQKQKSITKKISFMEMSNGNIVEKEQFNDELSLCLQTPFESYSTIRRGLTTGWNKMFINPKIPDKKNNTFLKKIISTPKSIKGYDTYSSTSDNVLILQKGDVIEEDIRDYIHSFELLLEKEKKPKVLYNKKQHSDEWYTLKPFDGNGILFSYFIRNDMKFVMNTADILVRDNFYILYPKIDKYLMFALLNNYYTYYQLEMAGKKYGGGLLKIQRYDIEQLKLLDITKLSSEDKQELILLAKDLIKSSNREDIIKITDVISKYLDVTSVSIMNAYENVKRKRLERL